MLLSATMLSALSAQYAQEVSNALFYARLQSWAEMRGLDGAAAHFERQADDEMGHAKKVLGYIHDRNEELQPLPVTVSPDAPADFVSAFRMAQERERATSDAIALLLAQAEGDPMTCAWLTQPGGLVLEQVEEERLAQTILDRITARGEENTGNATHDIDCWLKGLQ